MQNTEMIVDFETYCKSCKYKDVPEQWDPCNDCMSFPTNQESEKPVCYEAKDGR